MNENLSNRSPAARERVVLFLAFLTSEECREACQAVFRPDELAYAWCRLWFDAIYVPGTRYLDGIKGDRSAEAVTRFRTAFTDDELAAMERFHRFLELRIEMLPEPARRRASIPQNDAWDHVVQHAGYLLEELEPHPDSLRDELTPIVRALVQQHETSEATDDRPTSSLQNVLQQHLTD